MYIYWLDKRHSMREDILGQPLLQSDVCDASRVESKSPANLWLPFWLLFWEINTRQPRNTSTWVLACFLCGVLGPLILNDASVSLCFCLCVRCVWRWAGDSPPYGVWEVHELVLIHLQGRQLLQGACRAQQNTAEHKSRSVGSTNEVWQSKGRNSVCWCRRVMMCFHRNMEEVNVPHLEVMGGALQVLRGEGPLGEFFL